MIIRPNKNRAYSKTYKPNRGWFRRIKFFFKRHPIAMVAAVLVVFLLYISFLIFSQSNRTTELKLDLSKSHGKLTKLQRQIQINLEEVKSHKEKLAAAEKENAQLREEMNKLRRQDKIAGGLVEDAVTEDSPEAVKELPISSRSAESSTDPPAETDNSDMSKRDAVKAAFQHAWKNYKQYAWGQDELRPISKRGTSGQFDMGLTIIDSLSTIVLMDLEQEYQDSLDFIRNKLNVAPNHVINLFETTIRVLGGLLSAYSFKKDDILLQKAKELGSRLLAAFTTEGDLPYTDINPHTRKGSNPQWSRHSISTSEGGTLAIEWGFLSLLTGDSQYQELSEKALRALITSQMGTPDKLLRRWARYSGGFKDSFVTVGGRIDSTYEYYLKVPLLFGMEGREDMWNAWLTSVDAIEKELVLRTNSNPPMAFTSKKNTGKVERKMDHLECFFPGSLALSSTVPNNPYAERHLSLAKELAYTCYQMYATFPTGLAPEIATFSDTSLKTNARDHHNLLRPEAVEAFFYMWRVTKDPIYREWGWNVFQSFEAHSKIETGYCNRKNVESTAPSCDDKMESFFLAETLKYLYLLFSDDSVLPLDEFIFNTEAHPFPRQTAV